MPSLYKLFVRVRVDDSMRVIDNRAAVTQIEEPLLIMVGSEDGTTPPNLSRDLYTASPLAEDQRELVIVEGAGHTSVKQVPAFVEPYRAFLARVSGGSR